MNITNTILILKIYNLAFEFIYLEFNLFLKPIRLKIRSKAGKINK